MWNHGEGLQIKCLSLCKFKQFLDNNLPAFCWQVELCLWDSLVTKWLHLSHFLASLGLLPVLVNTQTKGSAWFAEKQKLRIPHNISYLQNQRVEEKAVLLQGALTTRVKCPLWKMCSCTFMLKHKCCIVLILYWIWSLSQAIHRWYKIVAIVIFNGREVQKHRTYKNTSENCILIKRKCYDIRSHMTLGEETDRHVQN